jgi:CHASE2 domain-containing sensor protein
MGLWRRVADKNLGHWLRVFVVVIIGLCASHVAREHQLWLWADLRWYQVVAELGWRPLKPRDTVVVLIDDQAFWKGELAGRLPLKRTFVARLVETIDEAGADVIAVDLDMRSADPTGAVRSHPDYAAETPPLIKALETAATRHRVVLSRALGVNRSNEAVAQSSIYDDDQLCERGESRELSFYCGYLEGPRDIRLIPPSVLLADGTYLASFAVATVHARRRQPPNEDFDTYRRLRYGSYIPIDVFKKTAVFPVGKILSSSASERRRVLEGKIVLVGGTWSQLAYGRGTLVDLWNTPVGDIPGVFVHANYIEALLDDRAHVMLPRWLAALIEIALLLLCALTFELTRRGILKTVAIAGLAMVVLAAEYFAFQNLGRVFDVFILLIFLIAHAGIEQILEWRAVAIRVRKAE